MDSQASAASYQDSVNGRTPGNISNAIGIVEPSSPVLIEMFGTYSHFGLNMSQEVDYKYKSASPGLVRKTPKTNAVVNRKLSYDWESTSIFSKVIIDKFLTVPDSTSTRDVG